MKEFLLKKKNLTVKKASLSIKPEIALIRLLRTNFRFWYDFYELKNIITNSSVFEIG